MWIRGFGVWGCRVWESTLSYRTLPSNMEFIEMATDLWLKLKAQGTKTGGHLHSNVEFSWSL